MTMKMPAWMHVRSTAQQALLSNRLGVPLYLTLKSCTGATRMGSPAAGLAAGMGFPAAGLAAGLAATRVAGLAARLEGLA